MKTIEKLVNATKDMKVGNHSVHIVTNEEKGIRSRSFRYYWTIICGVDDNRKEFFIDSSYGTMSTKKACNAYRRYFQSLGYAEIQLAGQAV